jgi:adenosine deaminase
MPPAPPANDPARLAREMPKVLLHEHLDGGLRVATLFELLNARGLASPADSAAGLARWFDARAHAGSLSDYLRGFELTVAAMATPAALERVAYEAAEDARAEGCVLAEFRIAALLFEAHGVSGEATVEALLAGLARSALPSGLIVCAMRHLPECETVRAAQLAVRCQGRGVIGFDLAGAERGHPAAAHARALALCRDAGLPLTLHAGEADAAERVVEAVRLGARRIGHGVRLADVLGDPARQAGLDEVRARDVHLEVCPTSNVHTGAARSIASHPITALWRAGVSLSFHTDNRLISRITHSGEALALLRHTPLTAADLLGMGLEAARHSFLAAPIRDGVQGQLRAWAAREGLPVPSAPCTPTKARP